MTDLFNLANVVSLPVLVGAIGLSCQLFWPLLRSRRDILMVQAGIGLGYGLQYALLDAWSGAFVCWLGTSQTLLILFAGKRRLQKAASLLMFPLLAIVGTITWVGAPSAFAMTACGLTMIGRYQNDTVRLRSIQLTAAPFGMAYDVSVGALPALCGGAIAASIAFIALYREIKRRFHAENNSPSLHGLPMAA